MLEITDGLAASFCAKVLSDLGADVVKVEPPEGHPSRHWAPRHVDATPAEPGGRFLYVNTGKTSVVVEDGLGGLEDLRRLAAASDVVVTDRPDHLSLAGADEATIVVAITAFGLTGPYAGYRAHHLVSFHAGGEGSILPSGPGWQQFPERPPIQVGGELAEYDAGGQGGRRGARRDVRPPPHRARAADRRLDPGVGAHAQPHAGSADSTTTTSSCDEKEAATASWA